MRIFTRSEWPKFELFKDGTIGRVLKGELRVAARQLKGIMKIIGVLLAVANNGLAD